MNYNFFNQKNCDRCHKSLVEGRTMSMFNEDCLCMKCKEKEREDPEYQQAADAEIAQVKADNYNYAGIRGGSR